MKIQNSQLISPEVTVNEMRVQHLILQTTVHNKPTFKDQNVYR